MNFNSRNKHKVIKKIIESSFLLAILLSVTLGLIIEPDFKIVGFKSLDENKLLTHSHMLTILDDEDNIINDSLQSKHIYSSLNQIPKHVQDAFISIEDKRFFSHSGIDFIRMLSAVRNNILAGSYVEGASTITQQLIKNTHLNNEKTMLRKLQEMRIAIDIERKISKAEILEIYLNILDFGNNVFGIGNASEVMFDKDVSELSISEGALLAGIINNPSRFNPYTNPDKALSRRNVVLSRMLHQDKLSDIEFANAKNEELILKKLDKHQAESFLSIIKEATELLNCTPNEIYNQNLTIKTNIDSNIQSSLQNVVSEFQELSDENILLKSIVLNNLSGDIVSLNTLSPFDITNSRRQPGSIIKPFLSFVPILENGSAVPSTPINDEKMDFNGYSPSNYRNKYLGWTTLKTALSQSSNVCAVKLIEINGIENSKKVASKFGLRFSNADDSYALALGSMKDGLTLRELANAYQVFANDGYYIKASFIDSILDAKGKVLYKRKIGQSKVCSSETAFFINDMLKDCVKNGTAKKLNKHSNVCAKTGTVGDEKGNTDAYCIAYSPEYTVAIWMGSSDYSKRIRPTGGSIPTNIASMIFDALPKSTTDFTKPDTIIEAEIDTLILNSKHKLVAASDTTLPKYKKKEYFTKRTLPKSY